jgi:hypothetical protein
MFGSSSNKKSGSGLLGAGLGMASGLLGMIGQKKRAKKQHERQKELMGIQSENQKMLNKQGQALQMQTWRDTGYGAQMGQMKEAGLNPALMYGMSGGGGQTTGSQGGGSAQSGSAAAPMDIGAVAQVALMTAQANKLKAETKNIEQDEKLKENQTKKVYNEADLLGYDRARKSMENEKMGIELRAITENEDAWLKSKYAEWGKSVIDYEAGKLGLDLTEEKIRQVQHKIWQDWVNAGSGVLASSSFITKALKDFFKK